MSDSDAPRQELIQPITQPQLPPSAVSLVRENDWPGKVFDLKASQLRKAAEEIPHMVRVIEPSACDSDGR